MALKLHLVAALAAVLVSSCSIKEDRSGCPCYLSLSFPEDVAAIRPDGLVSVSVRGRGTESSVVFPARDIPDAIEFKVSRGPVSIGAMLLDAEDGDDGPLLIPFGDDAGKFYAVNTGTVCSGETNHRELHLFKQFACLYLTIVGTSASSVPFTLAVRGNVCGWERWSLSPVTGDFYSAAVPDSFGRASFVLPRQLDDSLVLEFVPVDGGPAIAALDLGREIISRGYDWNAENLPDMKIQVQYTRLGVCIMTCEWDGSQIMEVEI